MYLLKKCVVLIRKFTTVAPTTCLPSEQQVSSQCFITLPVAYECMTEGEFTYNEIWPDISP